MSITLSYAKALQALVAAIRGGVTPILEGPPGTGKTALARHAFDEAGLPHHTLIASNCDATDFAGFPYVDPKSGSFRRALLPEIQACVDGPVGLILDEYKSTPLSVRAALMNVLLERKVQGQAFHAGSRVIGATNPPEMCPSGTESTAAEGNRVIVISYLPTMDEIQGYFDRLGPEGSTLRTEAKDFAATLAVEARLVTFVPSREAIDGGKPFPSPRAWEIAVKAVAAHVDLGGKVADDVGLALLCGVLGTDAAIAYGGIRKHRADLPTFEEILKDPGKAKVAPQREKQIAALGVISRVADKDVWPAWIYASRLDAEIAQACGRTLLRRKDVLPASKLSHEGKQAQMKLLAVVRRNIDA